MNCYTAYGYGIHSEIPLPGLLPSDSAAEIVIRMGREGEFPDECAGKPAYLRLSAGEALFSVKGSAAFLIRQGRAVTVYPAPGVSPGRVHLYLIGTVMALLLYQRGMLVLHASAVSIGGGVVAFVGESGLGKSSLAAALHGLGCPLVADDLTPVRFGAVGVTVQPGFPQVKLAPSVAAALGRKASELIRFHPGEEKQGCRLSENFPRRPLALTRLYLLDRQPGPEIESVRPAEAFLEVLGNSYPSKLMQSGGESHFRQCAAVARSVAAFRLRGFGSVDAIVARARSVLNHINAEGPPAASPTRSRRRRHDRIKANCSSYGGSRQ